MKKLFVLLTAALAFAAVACTEDNPSDNNGKDDGKEKAKVKYPLVSAPGRSLAVKGGKLLGFFLSIILTIILRIVLCAGNSSKCKCCGQDKK